MTRDGLLLAIAGAPEDDAARLIFADWLDEYGDDVDRAHAELIRVQIAWANLPPDDDLRAELETRVEELSYHKPVILKRLQAPPCVGFTLSRGFPDKVGFDWNDRRKGRLSEDELMGEVRKQGVDELKQVRQAFMEGDGHISVLKANGKGGRGKGRSQDKKVV